MALRETHQFGGHIQAVRRVRHSNTARPDVQRNYLYRIPSASSRHPSRLWAYTLRIDGPRKLEAEIPTSLVLWWLTSRDSIFTDAPPAPGRVWTLALYSHQRLRQEAHSNVPGLHWLPENGKGCRFVNADDEGGGKNGDNERMDLDGSETIKEVFLKRIRLQVNHWLALGTLSRTFGSPLGLGVASKVPSVSLIAVQYPSRPRSMEPWQTTVTNLLKNNPNTRYGAQDVIGFITSYLRPPYKPNQHPVFTRWRPAFHKQDIKFGATVRRWHRLWNTPIMFQLDKWEATSA